MNLNTWILIIYLAATLGIVIWSYTITKSSDDYFVANRNLGLAVSVGTYFATLVSAWSVLGATGYFYKLGWYGYWQFGGTILTSVFAAIWFGGKIRESGCVSLSEILDKRYNSPVLHLLSALLILGGSIVFLTVQVMGAGTVLNQVTGIDPTIGMAIGCGIFLFFTVVGGMYSVAWTDFFQALIIVAGVLIAVIIGLYKIGGIGALHTELAQVAPEWLDPTGGNPAALLAIVSWFCVWGIGNLGTPQFMSRFFACRDVKTVRLSQGITAICFAGFYFLIALMGGLAKVYFPGIEGMNNVGPTFIMGMLPPIVGAIIMSALLAAVMSTASSILLVAATVFVKDFYQNYTSKVPSEKQLMRVSRLATIAVTIFAFLFAYLKISSIFWLQANMVATMGASMATALIAGFAWKKANKYGAIASFLAGSGVSMIWFIADLNASTSLHPVIPGTISAIVMMIVVSLATSNKASGELTDYQVA